MSLFDALYRSGALRTVDHALGQSLRRLDPDTPDAVLAATALASLAVAQGHAAFDPARPNTVLDAAIAWPAPEDWLAALRASRWVANTATADAGVDAASGDTGAEAPARPDAPLVLDRGLLYLRRYREYERRLAAGLHRLAAQPTTPVDIAALAPLFHALFPQAAAGDLQARAAALALLRPLLLVSGGPGTGKTTTITRLLLLLIDQARHAGRSPPRIALAAPTGRAAERMAESLRKAAAMLGAIAGVDAALCDALPDAARTLHRLLGTIPDSPRFRHHAEAPLPFDVVVVDEASMVDLPLMCKLVEAVADGTRLILLGDPDQLPSVEAGDVLAAIVEAAGAGDALPADAAPLLAPLLGSLGDSVQRTVPVVPGLSGHRVHLRRGYRQSEALNLAPLAAATRNGDADAALALLRDGRLDGVHFHEGLHDLLAGPARDRLLTTWRALATAPDPAAALDQALRLRLLTALRDGPQGAHLLNTRIEEALAGAHRAAYFHGRLLLVTENSYRHNLFNGDIGVCLRSEGSPVGGRDEAGTPVAWFAGGSEGVRGFHPAALPAHGGAFAMTVHKAQGSEFDEVWLLLPRQDARTLSRELVYTALTRARRELHVCAGEQVLRDALARHAARVSGLSGRLRAHSPAG